MNSGIIHLDDREQWETASCIAASNPYLNWAYVKAMSLSFDADTYLYASSEGDAFLFSVFSVREPLQGYFEIYSPYGFGGLFVQGNEEQVAVLKSKWSDFVKEQGYITAFLMSYPLERLDSPVWQDMASDHSQVFILDLKLPKSTLWTGLKKGHKYEIKKAEKRTDIDILTKAEASVHEVFALYQSTVKRVGASAVYQFSEETLGELLHSDDTLLLASRVEGEIKALTIFIIGEKRAEYFISAATPDGRDLTRYLIWLAIDLLQERGVESLNLGGGVKEGDDLESFKRRFGGSPLRLQVIKLVADKKKYNALCEHFGSEDQQGGYFPPYWKTINRKDE